MKRSLLVVVLLLATVGLFYLYTTDSRIRDFLKGGQAEIPDSTLVTPLDVPEPPEEAKVEKKKIPKTVKPGPYAALDKYARNTPKQYTQDITTLAQYLIRPAKTDLQKMRTIFTWIALNIRYDNVAFSSGNYPEQSAENVLATRQAVCMGYSALMQALCIAADLNAEMVLGYAKGYGYKPGDKFADSNHAWNAVMIDDAWHLFDVTWASVGELTETGNVETRSAFEPFWFDTHPKAFIFTHLPTDPDRQLTGDVWTLEEYERSADLSSEFFKSGFDPNEIYREATSGKIEEFVAMYDMEFPMKVIDLPLAKNQRVGRELSFKIQSDYADDIVLIDGDNWLHFTKQDNTFTLLHKPISSNVEIAIRINWFDDYSTLAAYSSN